jgi:hypothetical protein
MTKKSGYYLYCLCKANKDLNFNIQGLKNNNIYFLKSNGYYAIISDIDEMIVDPVKDNLYTHENVILNIFDQTTIVPMSFGNIFKNREDIKHLIKKLIPELKKLLPRLKDKIELNLKIFWSPEDIIDEIAKENPNLKTNQSNDLYNQLSIGKEISMFIENKRQLYLQPIFDKLKPLAISFKENKLIGDKMILNAAFLIDKSKETKFDNIVNEIYKKNSDTFEFKYFGPLPPYNFVNIKIEIK